LKKTKIFSNGIADKTYCLDSMSLKTAVRIFQIVNNGGIVTQLFLVKLETYTESLQRRSLNDYVPFI